MFRWSKSFVAIGPPQKRHQIPVWRDTPNSFQNLMVHKSLFSIKNAHVWSYYLWDDILTFQTHLNISYTYTYIMDGLMKPPYINIYIYIEIYNINIPRNFRIRSLVIYIYRLYTPCGQSSSIRTVFPRCGRGAGQGETKWLSNHRGRWGSSIFGED